jgi:hypothetical protein
MVLLDDVAEISAERCVALWTVPAAGPWVEEGRLLRAALIEVAAQTAAAGATADPGHGIAPRRGYLGGISSFRVLSDVRVGDRLRCTARRTTTFGPLARIECAIEAIGALEPRAVAQGVLMVALAGG